MQSDTGTQLTCNTLALDRVPGAAANHASVHVCWPRSHIMCVLWPPSQRRTGEYSLLYPCAAVLLGGTPTGGLSSAAVPCAPSAHAGRRPSWL